MKVGVLDYSYGNMYSVLKALELVGVEAIKVSQPHEFKNVDGLILPGVGAFGEAMQILQNSNSIDPIKEFIISGKPFLGICLGMQLLMSHSEEFGDHQGIGVFKGSVKKFEENSGLRVPHVGWNEIHFVEESEINRGLGNNQEAYFVHSYRVNCEDSFIVKAQTSYGIELFPSIIAHENCWGMQFHPEKSGKLGLDLLKNWVKTF